MFDSNFIQWLKAKIEATEEFIAQVNGTPSFDEDDVYDLEQVKGELRGYQNVLKHLEFKDMEDYNA